MALLGTFFSGPLSAATLRTGTAKSIAGRTATALPINQSEKDILLDAYLPILKLNEQLKLHFYRCSKRKVTVGYGSNVEKNSGLLTNVTIFYSGKPLNAAQKKLFLSSMTSKTDAELKQYTISAHDAEKLMRTFAENAITKISQTFTDSKTKKSSFYDLPLCMQALCLDIFYNVGEEGFKGYKKFQAALKAKNYTQALKESVVYTNKTLRKTNKEREYRKKRLLAVMQIVQKYANNPAGDIIHHVQQDNARHQLPNYPQSVLDQQLSIEKGLATAEKAHMMLMQKRAQKALTKVAPALLRRHAVQGNG